MSPVEFPGFSQREVSYILPKVTVTWQTTPYSLGFRVPHLPSASQFPVMMHYHCYTQTTLWIFAILLLEPPGVWKARGP